MRPSPSDATRSSPASVCGEQRCPLRYNLRGVQRAIPPRSGTETYRGRKIWVSLDRNLFHQDWAREKAAAPPKWLAIWVRSRRMDMVCVARCSSHFNQEPRNPGKETKIYSRILGFQIHLNCDRAFVRHAQCE